MIINATIQVVPLLNTSESFLIIDKAIALIQQSGISHQVGAFETTLEGEYEKVQALIRALCDFCYGQPQVSFLIYTKFHLCGGSDIFIQAKTAKFE